MKTITLNEMHNMMYAEFTQLNAVERLLNDEGRDTLKALWDMMQICSFYDTVEEYAKDIGVQRILKKYSVRCRRISTYDWMLSQVLPDDFSDSDVNPF